MKGPQARIQYDVRRVWRCPKCGTEKKSSIDAVALKCSCQAGGIQMVLVEPNHLGGDFCHFSLEDYKESSSESADDKPETGTEDSL